MMLGDISYLLNPTTDFQRYQDLLQSQCTCLLAAQYFKTQELTILFPKRVQMKMRELIRDTVVGHLLRLATKGKALQYEEERDPSLWRRYIDKEKSGRMARHGNVEEEKNEEDNNDTGEQGQQRSGVAEGNTTANPRNSSDTRVGSGEAQRNKVSGVPVDPEKGRDVTIVTWFGDDDPEVCNFSVISALQFVSVNTD